MPGTKDKLKELPKLEEWKAPWEVNAAGEDIPAEEQKIEPDKLKKYLYNLQGDKLKLQGQVETEKTRADDLEKKVAEAPDASKLSDLQAEVTRTRQERDDARKQAEKDGDASLKALKLEVALEKGLTLVQAKRLLGTSKEELEQDAEELLASFGGKAAGGSTGETGETIARGPKKNLTNAGDTGKPGESEEEQEVDPDTWAAAYAKKRGR